MKSVTDKILLQFTVLSPAPKSVRPIEDKEYKSLVRLPELNLPERVEAENGSKQHGRSHLLL